MSSSEEKRNPVKGRAIWKARGKKKQDKTNMIQAVANDKIADRKDTTKQKKDKASEGKVTKDWKEDKISILIHL